MALHGQVKHPMVILTVELRRIFAAAMLRPGCRPFLLEMFQGIALVEIGWLRRDHSQRMDESSGLAWYDLTESGEAEVSAWKMSTLEGWER